MLQELPWLKISEGIEIELREAKDEGKEVSDFENKVRQIKVMEEGAEKELLAGKIYDELSNLPIAGGYPYVEPSDLEGIIACRPQLQPTEISVNHKLPVDELYNKIYGAWLGRCCGCLLGQPIEGWHRERIQALLKGTDNDPLARYLSSEIPEKIKKECEVTDYPGAYGNKMKSWINNVDYMPEDDDINYTIMGLTIVEEYGMDFTPEQVAKCWLDQLPILHLCTAERVAYRNFINMITPPDSATYKNPYREWIGAQIRADFYGYITPGNPILSAAMAWRDASISHTKNGIYGEMFVAAMLSAAAISKDLKVIINTGLSMIPVKSRLYSAITSVLDWHSSGVTWQSALDLIHLLYEEKNAHDWCHTIPNAMLVCIGLLYGELDFGKSIGISVMAGFDTDCNGATVGSVLGMLHGAAALPGQWITPLNNKVKSGIDGFGLVEISELAERTVRIIKKIN